MSAGPRPSSFLATKGLFPDQVYRAFERWDLNASLEDNVSAIRQNNTVAGPSLGWLKDFGKILLRRFGPAGPPRALVDLAKQRCEIHIWRPMLLWHACETDELLDAFLCRWLFSEHQRGSLRVTRESAESFLRDHLSEQGCDPWSDSNVTQSSSGLLRTASQFGLLTGGRRREFTGYHLPEDVFLYVSHRLLNQIESTAKVVNHLGWRRFLIEPRDVENELLRLHQMHRLQFQRAGSIVELRLPFDSEAEFARSLS